MGRIARIINVFLIRRSINQSINHVLLPSHIRRSLWRAAMCVLLYPAWSLVSMFSCPVLLSELRLSNPIFLCFLWILPCVPLLFASRLAAHPASFFHPLHCFASCSFAPYIAGILVGNVRPFPARFGTRNWGCRLTRSGVGICLVRSVLFVVVLSLHMCSCLIFCCIAPVRVGFLSSWLSSSDVDRWVFCLTSMLVSIVLLTCLLFLWSVCVFLSSLFGFLDAVVLCLFRCAMVVGWMVLYFGVCRG